MEQAKQFKLLFKRLWDFLNLGLTPSYKITNRIFIAFDFKIGHGYLWRDYGHKDNLSNDDGWYYRFLPAFRIGYQF